MKLNYAAVETISLLEFIKLDVSTQCKVLKQLGIFLESYADDTSLIKIYHVCGFFVEVIISNPALEKIEVIPYTTGYKVQHYKNVFFKTLSHPLPAVA